jgi:hypothetical protein
MKSATRKERKATESINVRTSKLEKTFNNLVAALSPAKMMILRAKLKEKQNECKNNKQNRLVFVINKTLGTSIDSKDLTELGGSE